MVRPNRRNRRGSEFDVSTRTRLVRGVCDYSPPKSCEARGVHLYHPLKAPGISLLYFFWMSFIYEKNHHLVPYHLGAA